MILGLSGKALAGKDTVADYLLDNYGWTRKTGFASNLKAACMEVFNLNEFQVFDQEGKSKEFLDPLTTSPWHIRQLIDWMNKTHRVDLTDKNYFSLIGKKLYTPRDILQFVGTEVMRYFVPNYHMEVVFRSVKPTENVIITDVRFPNEAQAILDNNGTLIRICRPDELRLQYGANIDSTHASEVALDGWSNWSYVLDNNTETLISLYKQIDDLLEGIDYEQRVPNCKASG